MQAVPLASELRSESAWPISVIARSLDHYIRDGSYSSLSSYSFGALGLQCGLEVAAKPCKPNVIIRATTRCTRLTFHTAFEAFQQPSSPVTPTNPRAKNRLRTPEQLAKNPRRTPRRTPEEPPEEQRKRRYKKTLQQALVLRATTPTINSQLTYTSTATSATSATSATFLRSSWSGEFHIGRRPAKTLQQTLFLQRKTPK